MSASLNSSDKRKLNEAMNQFKSRLETEKLLAIRMSKCIEVLASVCNRIISSLSHELVTTGMPDGVFSMKANERTLSFAAAAGMASDARLKHPRGLYCGQILVLGHTEGQDESTLLDAFRVYPDGHCSDGERSWKCEEHSEEFESYVVDLICHHLLDSDFFWPAFSELPESMRKVPIERNRLQTKSLEKTCIGFECTLPQHKL
ncbi:MAG: hypothetical protein K2X77_29820 [Candidatus Obscuribacterales bacterium]|jgi:hypothetical protein|nr:hypothetical protein [Candidatus Obscuribacterales bacterium]